MRRLTPPAAAVPAAILALCAALASAEDPKSADAPADQPQAQAPEKAAERPAVEVVFVLDTTGSMSGLINAAKEKIWAIANTLATAKPAPEIRIGLVAYRDRKDEYVTKVTDLSDDLDAVYKELMDYQAGGGGDGPESVNQALHEALAKIKWSEGEKTYRVVFLVGDAPPHMDYKDDVQYPETCKQAAKRGVVINTIQCGTQAATKPVWMKIAQLAEGQYFQVEQSGGAILEATPFDKELAELATDLGGTRVYYGKAEDRKGAFGAAAESERVAASAPTAAGARRAEFLGKPGGARSFLKESDGAKELVDAVSRGDVKLEEVAEAELPEKLREMKPAEREKYVKELSEKRAEVQKKIRELTEKRQAYIREKLEEKTGAQKDSLDQVLFKAIQKQAAEKGIEYTDLQY